MKCKYLPHYADLLRIGVPIMLGQMGTIVMGFADTLMIGNYGTQELAAVGFVNNIICLLFVTGLGFSYGLTPVVGALMGEGKADRVAGKLRSSLMVNATVGVLLMLAAGLFMAGLPCMGLPAELLPLMRPYFLTLMASILPQMLFNAYKQFSDGIEDTTVPMIVMLLANVLNIFGNWVLIFGHLGFPALGLTGAGIATLLSRVFQWLLMACIFHLSHRYDPHRQDFRRAASCVSDRRELYRLGWPLALQIGMETASFSLSALYVGWLGAKSLAAHQVMLTLGQLFFMLYYGMSAAVTVRVSHYRGAGNPDQMRRVAHAGLHINWLLAVLLSVPTLLLRDKVGLLFTHDREVVQLVSDVVLVMLAYQLGDALQCTYSGALRGMANVRPMVWIAFVAYFVISLPLGYLFGHVCGWGLVGIWLAFPFGLTTAGVLYYRESIAPTASPTKSIMNPEL